MPYKHGVTGSSPVVRTTRNPVVPTTTGRFYYMQLCTIYTFGSNAAATALFSFFYEDALCCVCQFINIAVDILVCSRAVIGVTEYFLQ